MNINQFDTRGDRDVAFTQAQTIVDNLNCEKLQDIWRLVDVCPLNSIVEVRDVGYGIIGLTIGKSSSFNSTRHSPRHSNIRVYDKDWQVLGQLIIQR